MILQTGMALSTCKSIWRVVWEHAFYATGMTYRLTKMAGKKRVWRNGVSTDSNTRPSVHNPFTWYLLVPVTYLGLEHILYCYIWYLYLRSFDSTGGWFWSLRGSGWGLLQWIMGYSLWWQVWLPRCTGHL